MQSTCQFPTCPRPTSCKGLCAAHYNQTRRGRPLAPLQPKQTGTDLRERLYSRVDRSGECWIWMPGVGSHGYGAVAWQGKKILAHRLSWELENGPIPQGMVIDHKCHTKRCVRPDHLQAVTQQENLENRAGAMPRNSSGVRGVSWDRARGKWAAAAKHDGKRYVAGRFESIADAEAAAIALRNRLHTNNLLDRIC